MNETASFTPIGPFENLIVGSPDWRRMVAQLQPGAAVAQAFSRGIDGVRALDAHAEGKRVRAKVAAEGISRSEESLADWITEVFLNTTASEIEIAGAAEEPLHLSRDSWSRGRDMRIETRRAILRPFAAEDAPAFREIAGDLEVARMMINIEHPLSEKAAARWIRQRRFRGRPGFFLGIYLDGQLAGSIGFGAFSNSLAYFLARAHWGKGLAGEIVPAFVADVIPRFALSSMFAGVFTDNPASSRILERIGFREVARSHFLSPARKKAERIIEMELTREQAPGYFAAIQLA